MSEVQVLIENLNNNSLSIRLDSLKTLMKKVDSGEIERPKTGEDVNNHIHTTYSFSPYSPTKALWMAYNAGLKTAGIVDHDSICGAQEFILAGEILGMSTTIGVECRADMSHTPLVGKKINNQDQASVAYMVLHGIPHTMIDTVKNFFSPYIEHRNIRNLKMIDKINCIFGTHGIKIDFKNDVIPLSKYQEGGSITERHISLALSNKLIAAFKKGEKLVSFLKNELNLEIDSKIENNLLDISNPFYEYDLLGFIKSGLITSFYINATDECPDISDVLALSTKIGSISAYAYMGDVGDSITGDKRVEKFEDDYINLLFQVIHELGFNAVTYMPPRNTLPQLIRVKALCEKYGLFEISGVDINSPRQSFVCPAMEKEEFKNLKDSTWALIGHEIAATENLTHGMFSKETIATYPDLNKRIDIFKELGINKIRGVEKL